MNNRTIVFGSPEANAIVSADRGLGKQEDDQRWYIVACEETNVVNYRVKAIDEMDAMDRCLDDGKEVETIDCVDFYPVKAQLDKNQDG